MPTASPPISDFPIQGLWIGTLGLLERLSMASFVAHGHRYHLYAYDALENLPAGVELHDAASIIPKDKIFQCRRGKKTKGGYLGFADLFRYRLLEQKGGWWCDTDVICLKPFDFREEIVMASERHWLWRNKLCNNVIFCPPGHRLMSACYEEALRTDTGRMRFAANGEPILRKHVQALKLQQYIQPPDIFNPIDWYHSRRITQPGGARFLPAESYALHCYRETWRWRLKQAQEKEFRNRVFTADTLLGALQRRYLPEDVI